MSSLSVIIPVYRAVATLEQLIISINNLKSINVNEIIFVYDCGKSESWIEIERLVEKYGNVKGIRLSRNFGQHNATICGFEFATGEYIVTMDEDFQHNPVSIDRLIDEQFQTGADVVYGIYDERKHSSFRNATSRILNRLLKVGIPDLHNDYSSFRLLRTELAKRTLSMRNSYTFLDGYLTWITTNVTSVKISHSESQAGVSSYTLLKLIEHSVSIFVTFSNLPIRILTFSSLVFFLLSFIYAIYIVTNTLLYDNYAAGFPSLAALLGFGFGFVLFGLGIIGEYIQKINLKTTNRPNYSIVKVI